VGKVCDQAVCGCNVLACKNTQENALLQAAREAHVGHWITRDQKRVYFDNEGNEYTGMAAMRRYQKDKKGSTSSSSSAAAGAGAAGKPRKPRRKRRARRHYSRSGRGGGGAEEE
jgi:hypothetical protein